MEELMPSARVVGGATAVFTKNVLGVPLALLYLSVFNSPYISLRNERLGHSRVRGFTCFSVGTLGLGSASARFIPEFLGRDEYSNALSVYRRILPLSSSLALALFIFHISSLVNHCLDSRLDL